MQVDMCKDRSYRLQLGDAYDLDEYNGNRDEHKLDKLMLTYEVIIDRINNNNLYIFK